MNFQVVKRRLRAGYANVKARYVVQYLQIFSSLNITIYSYVYMSLYVSFYRSVEKHNLISPNGQICLTFT